MFWRVSGAHGLGHVAWAFTDPSRSQGWFGMCGGVEENSGNPVSAAKNANHWSVTCADESGIMRAMVHNPTNRLRYDYFKRLPAPLPRPGVAHSVALFDASVPYVAILMNCLDETYRVLAAYGALLMPPPSLTVSPSVFFLAIPALPEQLSFA